MALNALNVVSDAWLTMVSILMIHIQIVDLLFKLSRDVGICTCCAILLVLGTTTLLSRQLCITIGFKTLWLIGQVSPSVDVLKIGVLVFEIKYTHIYI